VKENNSTEELCDDEVDLSSIASILWNRRKLIIFGTLGATLLSIVISLLLPRVYRSEGFYQLSSTKTAVIGVPVPLYKSDSSQFFDPNRFQTMARQDKSFSKEDLKEIAEDFRTAQDINKWIKPVYAFAKEDAREFSHLPKDESNSVIGLNLAYEADSPKTASVFVTFFGNYIRDCLMYVSLYNYVMDGYNNTISEMKKNENDITSVQFQLLQNTNKMKDIQAILIKYPESAKIESRQLVSIQEGGSRFLSPVTQLVGIESALADQRRAMAELERNKEKIATRAEYFSLCHSELTKMAERGESLFLLLKSIKAELFKNKDLSKDTVKEVFNNLSIDMQTFELAFFTNCRFISGPTIPDMHVRPKKSVIVIVTFFTSFFLLVIFSFASHWWQSNKKTITSAPSL
jgi:hypothetical protein